MGKIIFPSKKWDEEERRRERMMEIRETLAELRRSLRKFCEEYVNELTNRAIEEIEFAIDEFAEVTLPNFLLPYLTSFTQLFCSAGLGAVGIVTREYPFVVTSIPFILDALYSLYKGECPYLTWRLPRRLKYYWDLAGYKLKKFLSSEEV
jgi:hypothetical protein